MLLNRLAAQAALALLTAACASAQAPGTPSPRDRAGAVEAALLARRDELGDSARVEACGAAAVLGGAGALRLLDPRVASMLAGDAARCPRTEPYPRGSGPWLVLEGVERAGAGGLVVRARWIAPFARERTEEYRLEGGGSSGGFRVVEIRMTPSVIKDTQPLVRPPGR